MVSRRRFLILTGSAGVIGITAVTAPALLDGAESKGDRLPTLRYGEESCTRCGMLIDDVRFAAAWIAGSHEVHFDDIGCMVAEAAERPAPADARYYVTSYEDGAWIGAEDASYILSDEIRTPMAYGVAAAPHHAAAERIAHDAHGSIEGWHALPALLQPRHPEAAHPEQEHR